MAQWRAVLRRTARLLHVFSLPFSLLCRSTWKDSARFGSDRIEERKEEKKERNAWTKTLLLYPTDRCMQQQHRLGSILTIFEWKGNFSRRTNESKPTHARECEYIYTWRPSSRSCHEYDSGSSSSRRNESKYWTISNIAQRRRSWKGEEEKRHPSFLLLLHSRSLL